MRRNKYLDDLGIKIENYGSNFVKEKKFQRFIERRKYGFDYRQTIHMDLAFAEWIYSRLMMLLEQTDDDLTFQSIEFEGVHYTIEQAIHRILKAAQEYLYFFEVEEMDEETVEEEKRIRITNEIKAATRLWAEIMPYADRVVACRRMMKRLDKRNV